MRVVLTFTALTFVVAACAVTGDEEILGPSSVAATSGVDTSRRGGGDTTRKPRVDSGGRDTTPALPAKVDVSGRILGIVAVVPTAGSADTLRFGPVPQAKIRVMRNVLVNGAASQVLAAELMSDDAGRYSLKGLPGGYYIIYVEPPASSIWQKNWEYLAATSPKVIVDVYLWKRADG